jgi:hypothetical protein
MLVSDFHDSNVMPHYQTGVFREFEKAGVYPDYLVFKSSILKSLGNREQSQKIRAV